MTKTIEYLNSLNAQVVQLVEQGNINQAIALAQQVIELGQNLQLTEHPIFADSLNNLAELYRMYGRYSEAEPLYKQALNKRQDLFGEEHPDVAQSLNNLAVLYFSQGHYSQAEQHFFAVLNLWKHLLGDEHPQVAVVLNNIAEVYEEQGRYLDAEKIYLQILEIQKNLTGEKHPNIIWRTLNNLAALYQFQGQYTEAENKFLEALATIKHLLGSEHPDVAVTLNNLAALYDSQGHYSQAEKNYLQVLAIWKKVLGDEHPYVAVTLNNIGQVYSYQGRYKDAEQKHLEALAMRKRLFGEEHPDVASSLSNLAEIYLIQGRYKDAEQKYLEAYSIRKRLFTSEHPNIADSLNNLAVLYSYQGQYTKAEQKYLEALPIQERLLGKEHPDFANNLNNLAALYQEQGQYSQAEQKYLEVLAIRKKLLGEQHPDIADSLNEIAEIYRMQGRYPEAEQMHLEALAMRKRLLGEQHPHIAASFNNLAVLYYAQFKYSQAESFFLEALKIITSLFGNEHPQVASSMNNLAVIYGCQGRYLEAEQMNLEVLRIRKHLLGEEHPDVALSLNNVAEIYFFSGRYLEAEQKYAEALSMRKRLLGEEHPDVARSLNTLATVLAATERPAESLSYRIQASKINDLMIGRVFAFSSESDRLAFIQKMRGNFDLLLSLVYQHLSHSETAKQQALDFVLKHKALTAASLAAQNKALYSGRYPHLTEKFRQLNDLSTQLIHLTFSTPQLSAPQTSDFTTYRENLTQLQAQHNNLQKQLASQVPEIQLFEQTFDRYAVAEALPPNSILVEFVRLDVFNFHAVAANAEEQWHPFRYLAFLLPSKQPDAVQMIDLGEADAIDELIRIFRLQASDNTKRTLGWTKKVAPVPKLPIKPYNSTAAIQLSQALFHPIRDVVKDYKHLILAPDGNLNLVPFQILPFDETSTHLLMDEYIISYLGVGRDILRTQVQPKRPASAPLVIADPDFDLAGDPTNTISQKQGFYNRAKQTLIPEGEQTSTTSQEQQSQLRAQKSRVSPTDRHSQDAASLSPEESFPPGQTVRPVEQTDVSTKEEFINTLGEKGLSRAIGTRFLGESVAKKLQNAHFYLGTEALETRLTSCECPSIMLIATHGLFLPDFEQEPPTLERNLLSMERFSNIKVKNPMMRSGLALAGANTWLSGGTLPKDAGKGFVFAQDIAGLDLWANELTVLSACDTARGDIKIGEGVFGLRRAFAVAGSKTLVMSLWKVPDKATALLMERFFDNLQCGMARAKGLQDAQNYIRKITVKQLRQSTLGIEVLKELLDVDELSSNTKIDCQEEDTPLEHPFYWGAWICQGDTTPVVIKEVLK
ncbi:MAG: tetratricopeptide repeat protein [Brasilonema octagenarum HA4186-MV1]|jgi:tetratricopeptide (TPR) repeat protein|nr:tetratricopeptide repeat protein [Brasilonema octagenarum HA4186-MV1]